MTDMDTFATDGNRYTDQCT